MTKLFKPAPRVPRAPRVNAAKIPPKQTDEHYGSAAHKAWRLEVMKRGRWRCQWPGCTAHYPQDRLYADHIVELKDGGAPLDPRNGQILCNRHNVKKAVEAKKLRSKQEDYGLGV